MVVGWPLGGGRREEPMRTLKAGKGSREPTYPCPARYSFTDCCLGPLTVGSPPPWTPCPDGVLPRDATCLPAAADPAEGWLVGLRTRSRDWVWAAALRCSLAWGSAGWAVLRAWAEGWLGLAGYESDAMDLGEGQKMVGSKPTTGGVFCPVATRGQQRASAVNQAGTWRRIVCTRCVVTCCRGTGTPQRTSRGRGRGPAGRPGGTPCRRPGRSTPGGGCEPFAPVGEPKESGPGDRGGGWAGRRSH